MIMKFKVLVFFYVFGVVFQLILAQYGEPEPPAPVPPLAVKPTEKPRVIQPPAPKPPPPSPKPAPPPPKPALPSRPKPTLPKPVSKPSPVAPKPQPKTKPAPPEPKLLPKISPPPPKPKISKPAADLSCFADNLFVVDSTSSVREIFEQHRAYVENVANALAIGENGHHIGVIEYASQKRHFVKISLADKQKKENILKRIQNLRFMTGITATGAALEQAVEELGKRRANVQANVIVITDGFSYDHVSEAAKKLQAVSNVHIYGVAVGKIYRETELETIAGSKDNVFLGSDTYKTLLEKINPCGSKAVVEEETETTSAAPTPQAQASKAAQYQAPQNQGYDSAPIAASLAAKPKPSNKSTQKPTTKPVTIQKSTPKPFTTRKPTTKHPVKPHTVKPHPVGISPFICNPNDPTVVNCKDRKVFEKKVDDAGK